MASRNRLRLVYLQVGWMCLLVLALAVVGGSLEVLFVASLVGLLALVDVTELVHVTPQWRRRLRWILLVGLALFGYIVVRESLRVIS